MEKDLLWVHQIYGADGHGRSPMTLDGESFVCGGVTNSLSYSARIHSILLKEGILIRNGPTSTSTGIDISRVNPRFTHLFAFVNRAAQRKLIGLLCFWEEEVVRWRLLDEEEAEITMAIELAGAEREDLKVALRGVRMRREMRPSQRVGGESRTGRGGTDTDTVLPAYVERAP